MADGRFTGRARVFDSEAALIQALASAPERFEDRDIVVIRYEGPRGAPGMPELLDPTSRITALCRRRGITIALMTDARFSGGSVGLVIGHVSPGGGAGRPDRPHPGRRHDRRGRQPRHPRLRRTARRGDTRGAAGTVAGRGRTQRRYPPAGPASRHPAAAADARVRTAPAPGRRPVGSRRLSHGIKEVGKKRGTPDISMSASTSGAAWIYTSFGGVSVGWHLVGGTSEASPIFSGIVALADQVAHHRLGLLNPGLYLLGALSQHGNNSTGIVDVTSGNNSFAGVTGFDAGPGYDLASGWGTIDAAKFVPALARVG